MQQYGNFLQEDTHRSAGFADTINMSFHGDIRNNLLINKQICTLDIKRQFVFRY